MKRASRRAIRRFRALLCAALMLHAQLWFGGCNQAAVPPVGLPGPDGSIRIPLAADHPLKAALADTSFYDATALRIEPSKGSFRFEMPGDHREFAGRYTVTGDRFSISQLAVRLGDSQVTLTFDSARRVNGILTDAYQWSRPTDWGTLPPGPHADGVQAYLDANPELLEAARAFDLASGRGDAVGPVDDTMPNSGKPDNALIAPLVLLLGILVAVVVPLSGVVQALLITFSVATLVESILSAFLPVPQPQPQPTITDCDGNGIDDAADIADGTHDDCNDNATPDPCDLDAGTSADCDGNGVPDECQPDTDTDETIDACDLCPGFHDGFDADADGVPDGCDVCPGADDSADADADGVADGCDACPNDKPDDSDGDGVCDSADACPGFDDSGDSDGDGVADGCDLCPGFADSADTDGDGIPNGCDACPGFADSADADGDGVPDGCDACPNDKPDDSDGDGVCDSADACPGFDDNIDSDSDGIPDACDAEACCLPDFACQRLTEASCLAAGGSFQGWPSDCATIQCDQLTIEVDSSRSWLYESMHAPAADNCQVTFTATVLFDPWHNTSYSYVWLPVTPPPDRPGVTFIEIAGGGTNQVTYASPERPAYSPSCQPYVVTCVATGDQVPITGQASFNIDVRLLGDVNNSGCDPGGGCVDNGDETIILNVRNGTETDPILIEASDVNCDGSVDATDSLITAAVAAGAFDAHPFCIP